MSSRANSNLTVANIPRTPGGARVDLVLMAEMVERGAKVLDVGCGDGELLRLLGETRDVDGRGIELSREGVNQCVAKGLAVIQGDADTDLADYPDDGFDYVILSQTLQATRRPREALENMLRIGRRAIVHALNAGGASVSFVEIESDKGHDAFLLHEPMFIATTRGFLESAAAARGLKARA